MTLHPNYITNEQGQRLAVQLPIEEWNALVKELNNSPIVKDKNQRIDWKKAAKLALTDYKTDKELTILTQLDSEPFYEYNNETR